jgi:hypothetical protein
MSIKTLSMLSGCTVAAAGGSAMPFVPYGKVIANGTSVMNVTEPSYQLRNVCTFSVKHPTVQADGELSKFNKKGTYLMPFTLASGKIVYPIIRIQMEDHPEMTAAEITEFRLRGVQLLNDPDLVAFWETGSTE